MVKNTLDKKKSFKPSKLPKTPKIDPIPELKCVQDARSGANDGVYEVTIPLKYMLAAYEAPAAWFVFKFVGMIKNG